MAVSTPSGRLKALFTVLAQFGYRTFAWRRFVGCMCVSDLEFTGLKR
jgi:hypothetical protein